MVNRFLKDSAIYGLSNLLTRGVVFLLIPIATRVFTPYDFGVVDILTIFATVVNVTVALEISQAVARFFTDATTKEKKIGYASTSLWFTLIAYTFFFTIAYKFSQSLSVRLFGTSSQDMVLRVALIAIWVNGLYYLIQNQLRWELKPIYYSYTNISFTVSNVATTVFLVLVAKWGVVSVFWGQVVGGLVGTLIGFWFVRSSYHLLFEWSKLWTMLRFSLPLVPSSLGVIVILYIDRMALKELMDLSSVGIFGVGYRIASITGLLMVTFQSSLTPLIYKNFRESDTPMELARIFRYFVAFALLLCLTLGLFAQEIMRLITTPDYYDGATVVPLLAPAILLYNMYIFAPGLSIAKQTGMIAIVNIICGIENMILNFALIPHWGIIGAALATFISSSSFFACYMITSQRTYYVPHKWKPLGLSVVCVLMIMYWGTHVPYSSWLGLLINCCLIFLAGVIFILVGLVTRNDIQTGIVRLQHIISSWSIT
jgi:O-antigen/teichoic acid export membrane protein